MASLTCAFIIMAAEAAEEADSFIDLRLIIAFGVVIGIMFFMPRILRKNRKERKLMEKQYIDEVNNRLNVKSEADRIMIEIVETGRQINAQLDTKIRVLNKLLKDTQLLVDRLEKSGVLGSENPGAQANNNVAPISPVNIENNRSVNDDAGGIAGLAAEMVYTGETTIALAPPEKSDSGQSADEFENEDESSGSGRWKNNLRKKIATMAEEGRSVESIARLTRLSTSEVSLMLDLINAGK